jgi:glycosyltransferase involved in cell wall biosynthesis
MKKSRMKASVIIPTHNREDILSGVLEYYCRQSAPEDSFEVVVVDDGSTDDTPSLFRGLKDFEGYGGESDRADHLGRIISAKKGLYKPSGNVALRPDPGHVNLIYIQLKKAGRSVTRNIGILFSSHPLIIFADDDIFVEPGFVEKHIYAHSPEDSLVVMGRVIHTESLENPLSARWKLKDINTAFLATGNASVLKKYLIEAGLFDEDYTVYGWEDFDLGIHLEKIGLKSQKRNICGYHYDPPVKYLEPGAIYKKEKERGFTAVYFYQNHPLHWVERFTLINNRALKALVGLFGHGNWFLSRERISCLRGFFRLIIRYKGYFDGINEGIKQYMACGTGRGAETK